MKSTVQRAMLLKDRKEPTDAACGPANEFFPVFF